MNTALEALDALIGTPSQQAEFLLKYHINSISGYLRAILERKEEKPA